MLKERLPGLSTGLLVQEVWNGAQEFATESESVMFDGIKSESIGN